jgi:diguanylate cyclase (GGDEF)-like protein
MDAQRKEAYSVKAPIAFDRVEDERWGELLVAHAPIFDRDGEMLGLAGVDIDAAMLYGHIKRLNVMLLAIYALVMGLSLALMLKYSNAFLDLLLKDKLTGAYSKRHFEGLLQREMAASIRRRKDLALLMLDLDHFKSVNDTYGHPFGDKVLSTVADAIRASLRPTDCFIRYGGEEFAVLIANTDIAHAMDVAERIRKAVEDTPIFNEERSALVNMTISVGVSNFNHLGINPRELVENADKALYDAKISRNTVSRYDGAK